MKRCSTRILLVKVLRIVLSPPQSLPSRRVSAHSLTGRAAGREEGFDRPSERCEGGRTTKEGFDELSMKASWVGGSSPGSKSGNREAQSSVTGSVSKH